MFFLNNIKLECKGLVNDRKPMGEEVIWPLHKTEAAKLWEEDTFVLLDSGCSVIV